MSKYAVGDTVYWRDHNDEPMIYGVVVEVHDAVTHFYYYVDYETPSGYGMRAGMPERDIWGVMPRVEKVINPEPLLPWQKDIAKSVGHKVDE